MIKTLTTKQMNQPIPTIKDVEKKLGFIINRENGLIEQAIESSTLSSELKSYARQADFRLTFSLGYRDIMDTFFDYNWENKSFDIDTDNIITAVSIAIDSEVYNIKTILDTLDLEYNVLENIGINEQTVTSSTISASHLYDKISTSKNIGEIQKTDNETYEHGIEKTITSEDIVDTKGAYSETGKQTDKLGEIGTSQEITTTIGEQKNTNTTTLTHAPYNVDNYTPKDQTNVNENLGTHTDTQETTSVQDAVTNVSDTTQNITERQDSINRDITLTKQASTDTITNQSTQKPYEENTLTNERSDKENKNGNENKNRTLTGLQGIAPQDLILKQRELANVDIVKWLCKITVNTIGQGFIQSW